MNKLLYLSFIAVLNSSAMCVNQDDALFRQLSNILRELSVSGKSASEIQSIIDQAGLRDMRSVEADREAEAYDAALSLALSKKPAAVLNADILNDICLIRCYNNYTYDSGVKIDSSSMLGYVVDDDLQRFVHNSSHGGRKYKNKFFERSRENLISVLNGNGNAFYYPLRYTELDIFAYMLAFDRQKAKRSYAYLGNKYHNEKEKVDSINVLVDQAYDAFDNATELKSQISGMIKQFDDCMSDAVTVSNMIAFIRELSQYPELASALNFNAPEFKVMANRGELFQYVLENEDMIDAIVRVSELDLRKIYDDFGDDVWDIFENIGEHRSPISKETVVNVLKTYSSGNIENVVNALFANSDLKPLMRITSKLRHVAAPSMWGNTGMGEKYERLIQTKRYFEERHTRLDME